MINDYRNVMALRKRMILRGYSDIHFKQCRPFDGFYLLSFVEPISNQYIKCRIHYFDMPHLCQFRRNI